MNEPIEENLRGAIKDIARLIEKFEIVRNKTLIEICRRNGIELVSKESETHFVHELLETAINQFTLKSFNQLYSAGEKFRTITLNQLLKLTVILPPQSWRGREQIYLQQFSTPPALGFLMAQILAPEAGKVALEPSAGTGNLAIWLKSAGCRTEVNEISARRRMLLELQGFQAHAINAEFLDDLLPDRIEPDYVLMNPPFSASLGRADTRDSNFGFRHVEAALLRLKPGGSLVALLGADACLKTDKGKTFWHRINREYQVRAFLVVPREVFYKYGTTFQTVIVIVSKPESNDQPTFAKPQICEFADLTEMLRFVEVFNATKH